MCKDTFLTRIFDFYSVFEGFDGLDSLDMREDVFKNIEYLLLEKYPSIKEVFHFDDTSSYALSLLARNDRKRFSINRKIEHFKALSTLKYLLKTNIISIEYSKEIRIRHKGQKVKKELRSYVIEDKILFKDHFSRFFFYFLKPNEKLILQSRFKELLALIKGNFELYQSFCFEKLSRQLLEKKFCIHGVQSYWDQHLELDLYYRDDSLSLIGEVKFKNKKICKNIFNLLKYKAKYLNLNPNYYVIISKNGFSKRFYKIAKHNLLLFDLNDFKILLEDAK